MLRHWTIQPRSVVRFAADRCGFQGWRAVPVTGQSVVGVRLAQGDHLTLDFGEHLVGRLLLTVRTAGSALLEPRLAEVASELVDCHEQYPGKLEARWQHWPLTVAEAGLHTLRSARRHAFQFADLHIAQADEPVEIVAVEAVAESAAPAMVDRPEAMLPAEIDPQLRQMDTVALRTLRNCMQAVFEDGPKRDRRLWLGDLYLQARTAYATFGCHDLIRRCLYLLAGCVRPDGYVPACVFEKPTWHHGSEFIPDYALLFGPTLLEYAQASGDWDTARDLWPLARQQVRLVEEMTGTTGLVRDRGDRWLFIDWQDQLDREGPLQGVFIHGLRRTLDLGRALKVDSDTLEPIKAVLARLVCACTSLWDADRGCFVSGPRRQVSWATQVWMVLADVPDQERARRALRSVMKAPDAVRPRTPYLYHYVVEALWRCGLIGEAQDLLRSYWGGMLQRGATTFWEVFDPADDRSSPYGSHLVNSYCHAWSCTPSWFIRQGLFDGREGIAPNVVITGRAAAAPGASIPESIT